MNYPDLALASAARFDRRLSLVVLGVLTLVAVAALATQLRSVPVHGILPLVMGFVIVTELLSSALFLMLLVRSHLGAAAFAAAAYLLSATLSFPYLLFFPNVFARAVPLGGNLQTSFEFWIAWHAAYPIALIGYALTLRWYSRPVTHPVRVAVAAVAASLCLALFVVWSVMAVGGRVALLQGTNFTPLARDAIMPALCALDLLAIGVLWVCTRLQSALHVWLGVALYASVLDVVLGISPARYSSGWYAGKFLALTASGTIVILFLSVFSRMYGDAIRAYDELGRARERDAEAREDQRRHQEQLLRQAGSVANVGTWELDLRSGALAWSDALYEMFNVPHRSVITIEAYLARVHPADREKARAFFQPPFADEPTFSHRLIAGDGTVRAIEGRMECLRSPDGSLETCFGTIVDRTERASIETRLREALETDATTALPNRATARAHLVETLSHREIADSSLLALLVIDVDRMKLVNDAIGHSGGDRFLEIVAERLREAAGSAYVARASGDEFYVIVERCEHRDDAAVFGRRLLKTVSAATTVFNREFAISMSIGIAMYPADGITEDELIRCADIAMYEAKGAGGNAVRFFSSGMRDEQIENAALESEIRAALRAAQFHLEYQPIVSAQNGELFGVEALLRWLHPTRGPVSPQVIIEIAERSGLMGRLGAWILSEGIRQRALWAPRTLTMALNVSASQLQNPDFTLLLGRMLSSNGVEPSAIELELTESAAMEGALVADQMRSCISLGIRFALDDFGTHYSSISYLQRLAVDRIKIDRTFVRELPSNKRDAAIVRALIALAHSLGRTVIAEGVEDQRQLAWLREAGCDFVQGYAIARPMTAAAFERWMALPGNASPVRLQTGTTDVT
jgi:diguanylate cyclase (GGDEF)-like protein